MVLVVFAALILFVSTGIFAWAGNRLMQLTLADLHQVYDDIRTQDRRRADLTARLLTVQEEERKRIARDIHDGPMQDMTVLLLGLTELRSQAVGRNPQAAQETALRLRQEGRRIMDSLRALTNDLRPAVLDHYGLPGALDYLARRETTFAVAVDCRVVVRLDPSVETVIFRLVQEALANIRQHAHARRADIRLLAQGDGWGLDVCDDGRGFDLAAARKQALARGHMGLASMAERLDLVGGTLTIQSAPGHGTQIHVQIPDNATRRPAEGAAPLRNDRSIQAPSPDPALRLH
jgi:signal transduction histidine kinase